MSYESDDTKEIGEIGNLDAVETKLSPAGRRAMQGPEPISPLDQSDEALATIDSSLLKTETQASLQAQEMTSESVFSDNSGAQAEALARTVLEREGIPDGSGEMEPVNRVVPGTYDGKHGIDLIATTQDGHPVPIEVKKRLDSSNAHLDDEKDDWEIHRLEDCVEKARQEREYQLQMYHDGNLNQLRPDYNADWNPEVVQWKREVERDLSRSKVEDGIVRFPVEQMDDLWIKDRYIKLLQSDNGSDRLQTAGVAPEYCAVENFVDQNGDLIDTPLWDEILDRRATVIVSPSDSPASGKMLRQAVFENRSKRVLTIRLKD